MAYFTQVRGRWRAQVERRNVRESRVFDTRPEAETWATGRERVIENRHRMKVALADSTLASRLPRRLLDALANVEYDHDEIVNSALPVEHTSGVYFLVLRRKVVYVGQSVNIFHRIARHQRDGKVEFDSFNYIHCAPEKMTEMESRHIAALMPSWNMSFGGSVASRVHPPDRSA